MKLYLTLCMETKPSTCYSTSSPPTTTPPTTPTTSSSSTAESHVPPPLSSPHQRPRHRPSQRPLLLQRLRPAEKGHPLRRKPRTPRRKSTQKVNIRGEGFHGKFAFLHINLKSLPPAAALQRHNKRVGST